MQNIQGKMQFAGLAYQHFLIAVTSPPENCLNQARELFLQQFEWMVPQPSHSDALHSSELQSNKAQIFQNQLLQLQGKVLHFSQQFENLYAEVFNQFKAEYSVLILDNPKQAFAQWTQMFDEAYLKFMHQDAVSKEFAEILMLVMQLNQLAIDLHE